MSIYDLSNAGSSSPYRNNSVSESSKVAGAGKVTPQQNAASQGAEGGDRVDISDAGRAAQAEDAARVKDVAVGRRALQELGPSQERLDEIRQRVQDGYYTQPDTLSEVAKRLASDL